MTPSALLLLSIFGPKLYMKTTLHDTLGISLIKKDLIKNTLMMANERSESAQDNFGKFIHQFQPWNQDTYQETWKDLNKII